MLRVTAEGWLPPKYTVLDDGLPIARFVWADRTLMIHRKEYRLVESGFWRKTYSLIGEEISAVARDTKYLLGKDIEIKHASHRYILKRKSWFSSDLEIHEGDIILGTIRSKGVIRSGAEADLSTNIPIEIRVFMVWLAIEFWKRHNHAIANGGAAND